MKNCYRIPVLIIWVSICFLNPAGAGENPYALSLAGGIIPVISGNAGEGEGAPGYSDASGKGLCLSAELSFQLNPAVSLLGGIGYEHYPGTTYKGITFSNREIIPVYMGMKYYFRNTSQTWMPYIRADLGTVRFESVDISYLGSETRYWEKSFEWMIDAGAGMEYRMKSLAWFVEIKARHIDNPSSALTGYAGAGSSWSMPVVTGLTVYF